MVGTVRPFLTSALDGDGLSASLPGRFIPGERAPLYPFDKRLCGHQSRSGRGGEENNFLPYRELNPDSSAVQTVFRHFTDWAISAVLLYNT
jgi:hypothetical protein